MDSRQRRWLSAFWLALLLLGTTSNAAFAQAYGYGLASDTGSVRNPIVTLQAGNVGTSAISLNTESTVTISPPPAYVTILLTNSQGSATPNPFQQLIAINPSTYSGYEASDLGNIRFCMDNACGTPLYSWLEGCGASEPLGACSTSSTSATFWVKLTTAIAASGGTLTIYMVFLSTATDFDGNVAGESPLLSGTYAHFDNGASLFGFYDDFVNLNQWTTPTISGHPTFTASNGLTISNVGGGNGAFAFATWTPPSSGNAVVEAYVVNTNCANAFLVSLATGTTAATSSNPFTGYLHGWGFGSCASDSWQGQLSGSTITLTSSTSGACAGVTGTTTVDQAVWISGSPNSLTDTMSPAKCTADSATDNHIAMSSLNQAMVGVRGGALSFTVNWYRVRTAPPNNVMPSTALGNIVLISGAPGAAYYEIASASVPCSVTVDTSTTPSASSGSFTMATGKSTCLVSPAFSSSTSIAAGPWLVDLFASVTTSGTLVTSLQVETSSGGIVSTVFSGNTGSIQTAKTEVKNYFAGSAVTVPSGDYLVLQLGTVAGGNIATFTIYWGSGQQTNFQLPNTYGYILSLTNPSGSGGGANWLVNLGYASSSNSRFYNMTVFLEAPLSRQIIIGTGIGSPTQPNTFGPQVSLAPSTTMYIGLGIVANSGGTTVVTITLKIQVTPTGGAASAYCQDTIAITVN